MTKALITGISGQDGSYLAELLLSKGYEVHGIVMRRELEDPDRSLYNIASILDQVTLHPASIESFTSLFTVVQKVQPDECYHLAAASFVSYSLDDEFSIFNSNVNGTHYILSILNNTAPKCKFYFAASSELFGNAVSAPQNENSLINPRFAYGITKATGYFLTNNYRDNYGLFACNGILYNHESPRRGYEFVTRKIVRGAVQIKQGLLDKLELGNLDAQRDWGYAPDYVRAMWLMLQQPKPDNYVVATGELHSVRELCDLAFSQVGLDYQKYVVSIPKFFRQAEKVPLVGDASKARAVLGWQPEVPFEEMVRRMVESELAEFRKTEPAAKHISQPEGGELIQ